jgi:hypothetical protein
MLDLAIGILDDAGIREAHQASGQPLHILPALCFAQPPGIEALTEQVEFGF